MEPQPQGPQAQLGYMAYVTVARTGAQASQPSRPRAPPPPEDRFEDPHPPTPPESYWRGAPNPDPYNPAREIQFPTTDVPHNTIIEWFKALIQYWGPTPEQIVRTFIEVMTRSPLDRLYESYNWGTGRLDPETHMHNSPPPLGFMSWSDYAQPHPNDWPYAFTGFFALDPTNDGRFLWFWGWKPDVPIWDFESKSWLAPSPEPHVGRDGTSRPLYDTRTNPLIEGGEWYDPIFFGVLPIGAGFYSSYDPPPEIGPPQGRNLVAMP